MFIELRWHFRDFIRNSVANSVAFYAKSGSTGSPEHSRREVVQQLFPAAKARLITLLCEEVERRDVVQLDLGPAMQFSPL